MVPTMVRFSLGENGSPQDCCWKKTVNNSRHEAAAACSLVTSWTRLERERESIQFLCLHLVLACVKLTSWKWTWDEATSSPTSSSSSSAAMPRNTRKDYDSNTQAYASHLQPFQSIHPFDYNGAYYKSVLAVNTTVRSLCAVLVISSPIYGDKVMLP